MYLNLKLNFLGGEAYERGATKLPKQQNNYLGEEAWL
jgi:hypothetical protein